MTEKVVIFLKDGTEIPCKTATSGLGEVEWLYVRPEELFCLEDIAEIQLEGFTIIPSEA